MRGLGSGVFLFALCLARAAPASATACTAGDHGQCGALYCDFPVVARPGCAFVWPSSGGSPMAFMCATSNLTGVCRACPPGWTALGAFCVECDALGSCDASGVRRCDGACAAGRYPTCNAATGRSDCEPCAVNESDLSAGHRRLTRGGVLDAPWLCGAYFECDVGFYLATATEGGELACLPCEAAEAPGAMGSPLFLSRGLTFGDRYSCLYRAGSPRVANNSWGEYGPFLRSCPAGKTSLAGFAAQEADCVECPSPPAYGRFAADSTACAPACNAGYELRGQACVPLDASGVDCDGDGYALEGSQCSPSALPWSSPGSRAGGGVAVAVQGRPGGGWDSLDGAGDFRVLRATKALARAGVDDFCTGVRSTIDNKGYVQDKPLFTQACVDAESHVMYLVASGDKYVYVFLERPFGNNNRFIMWQVQKAAAVPPRGNPGQVWQTFRLPAKVCSAAVVPGAQGDTVYLALCGSPMLTYAAQRDYMDAPADPENPPFVLDGTQYVLGRRLGVLIGSDEKGNRDGMRDQALFRGPLSIAASPLDPRRLLVADHGNCRVAEVFVDSPGSFLTRAATVGASACFSGAFPLPFPRAMTYVLGGAAALFVTDRGLVQLDARMRRFSLVMGAERVREAIGEPLWILADQGGERLVLHNATHTAWVTREQESCPPRHKAARGGACEPCPVGTFSTGVACAACSAPACPSNFSLVPCSDGADAYCRACQGSAPYPFRFGEDCQVIPKFPCPEGYFGLDDCAPCSPVPFRQLPPHGACQCLGFPLAAGGVCEIGSPLPETPAWVLPLRCAYDADANCSYAGCYLASVQPRACLPCPPDRFSVDGLRCGECPGFRQPSPARDACICRPPAVVSRDGASCVCPPGHAAGGPEGCSPCAPGTVSLAPTALPDNYPSFQGGRCFFCPPGFEPSQDRAWCDPCQPGKYREGAMPSCVSCQDPLSFAVEAGRGATCRPCAESCGEGERWSPCPVNASYYACSGCPRLSRFRAQVPGGRNCEWKCLRGFYEYNQDCFPCTSLECAHGFKQTPCSRYEDAHCRVPCENATKPADHSEWGPGCTWRCAEGYVARVKRYLTWAEHKCFLPEDLPWSLWS